MRAGLSRRVAAMEVPQQHVVPGMHAALIRAAVGGELPGAVALWEGITGAPLSSQHIGRVERVAERIRATLAEMDRRTSPATLEE